MNNKTEKEVIPSAKDSSVNLGKTLFVFTCFDLARFFVGTNAIKRGESALEKRMQFDSAFEKLKDSYLEVHRKGLNLDNVDFDDQTWKNFIEAKREVIQLVWPEIKTSILTNEGVLRF